MGSEMCIRDSHYHFNSYHQPVANYFNEYSRMTSIQPNYVPAPCDIWRPQTTTSMPTPSPLSSAEDEVSRVISNQNPPEMGCERGFSISTRSRLLAVYSILWHFQNNPSFGYPDPSLVSGVVVGSSN